LAYNQTLCSTQPGSPSVGRCNEYQRKLARKQAGVPARICGFTVLAGVGLRASETEISAALSALGRTLLFCLCYNVILLSDIIGLSSSVARQSSYTA